MNFAKVFPGEKISRNAKSVETKMEGRGIPWTKERLKH